MSNSRIVRLFQHNKAAREAYAQYHDTNDDDTTDWWRERGWELAFIESRDTYIVGIAKPTE